nr:MAG TPA: hypothetical protein [Caudoviricetes sp.]
MLQTIRERRSGVLQYCRSKSKEYKSYPCH